MSDLKSVTKSKNNKATQSSKQAVKNQSKNIKDLTENSGNSNKVLSAKQKAMISGNHNEDSVETYIDFQIENNSSIC